MVYDIDNLLDRWIASSHSY